MRYLIIGLLFSIFLLKDKDVIVVTNKNKIDVLIVLFILTLLWPLLLTAKIIDFLQKRRK